MVLKYSFEYVSNNGLLPYFISKIINEFSLEYKIIEQNSMIELYVKGSLEVLEEFSTCLSNHLPMSIFLKQTQVDVCEAFPSISTNISLNKKESFPFCPKCLSVVENSSDKNYFNPFYRCDYCQDTPLKGTLNWSELSEHAMTDYVSIIQEVASKIGQGLKVNIQTQSGSFVFEKMSLSDTTKEQSVLCTNLMNLSTVFVAKKSEVIALACLEKPQISLAINAIYAQKNPNFNQNVKVRYANDLLLYLLSKVLQEHHIDFLSYSKSETYDCSLEMQWNQKSVLPIPFIKILDNNQVVFFKNKKDKQLMQMYDKFEQKNKGHFMVLLQEHNLYDNTIINFYASSLDDDNICLYSNNIGSFLDILNYELPHSMEEVFELIQEDETGKRLFDNYKKEFASNIEKALLFDMSTIQQHSIVSLWKLVRVLLGFETTVLNHAMGSLLEKGPRIDYKLFAQEKVYNQQFNFIQLLRCGMSYKLAGVEDNAIALGYIESYAHFIANIVDEVNQDIPLDGISLCGDIFSNNLISNFVHKSITKNYKIYYNKDFVIQVS
jgi:hypothetical protein